MNRSFFSYLFLTSSLAPGTVFSQDVADVNVLLDQGEEQLRAGQNDEALATFRQSLTAQRTGRGFVGLARAERAQGHLLDAETHFAEALNFPEERWIRHHRRDLDGALAEVRASISTVRVSSNIDGAEVRINGTRAGVIPLREPVRVPVGNVTVQLRAEGFTTVSRTVTVMAFTPAETHINLDRIAPLPSAEVTPLQCAPGLVLRSGLCFTPDPVDDGSISPYRWMLYLGGGVAVVSTALAVGLWADGNSTEDNYLSRCGGASVARNCQTEWRQTQDDLSSRAVVVNVLWVVAGLAAATAVSGLGFELRHRRRPIPVAMVSGGLSVQW
jgi:hypothetical protein